MEQRTQEHTHTVLSPQGYEAVKCLLPMASYSPDRLLSLSASDVGCLCIYHFLTENKLKES